MKIFLYLVLALLSFEAIAQVKISGKAKNSSGEPLPFATIYLDETFEGGASDVDGAFHFESKSKGTFTLVISAIGFETIRQSITIEDQPLDFAFTLQSVSQVLNNVVISAGSFEASDKAKATLLKPLDIVMNAGAQGDIFKAIETLPGVSKVANETGLFVRGGDAHETRTIIDGTVVQKPFFGEVPNVASRSRFDPFMFKGTIFTTGGYSSEYGGALSSVLLLETQDIPEESQSSIGLNFAGINLSHQQVWGDKTTVMGDVSYNNLSPLFRTVPQNVRWAKKPEGFGTNWALRHKTKNGIFKSLVQHQQGKIGLHTINFEEPGKPHTFNNANSATYLNTNYKGTLNDKLGIYTGLAVNHSTDNINFNELSLSDESTMLHVKTTLYYDIKNKTAIKFGAESFIEEDIRKTNVTRRAEDQHTAIFTESDIALGTRWAFRVGVRSEYSSFLNKINVAPRTSMAYKTGINSQISLAYGHFYQKPEDDFRFLKKELEFEQATHMIVNYQWIVKDRSFRIELYDKQYYNLVKGQADVGLQNDGHGYSRGIDVFWKDEKTLKNLEYWLSYSYLDAERNYKDYPTSATPAFVTDHTMNIVANYDMEQIGLRPGLTYTYATGRRYFNPTGEFMSDRTPDYHNLSFNLSYVTRVFNNFAVMYGAVGNPFGFEQIFGYEYAANGTQRSAIKPPSKRTFFFGLFVNL